MLIAIAYLLKFLFVLFSFLHCLKIELPEHDIAPQIV